MEKLKLPKTLKRAVADYIKMKESAREAGNAANREKTKLKNAVKAEWASNQHPVGTFIRSGGLDIKYEASDSVKIDAEGVLKLYEADEITREQFVQMLNIDKTQAKKILGADQVMDLEIEVPGKDADIRVSDTPIDEIDDEYIAVTSKPIRSKPRKKFGGKPTSKAAVASRPKSRRRVRVHK